MRRTVPLLLLLFVLPLASARAEDDPVAEALEGLSGKDILAFVKELAADEMQGRKTGFAGGARAENWLVSKMLEFGLHPADAAGAYLEPFTFPAANTKAPISLRVGDEKKVYGEDFYDLIYAGSGKVTGKVVFCGYGIDRPDVGWDDYGGVDVEGKVVMAIRGAPKARAYEFQEERYIGYKSWKAAQKGAAGFLLVEGEKAGSGTIQGRFYSANMPALWVSAKVADAILGKKMLDLKAARDEGDPGTSFATDTTVSLEVNSDFLPNAKGNNAMGYIKGRDPDLSKEHIVVGAHLDHLGVDPLGRVYNGADDNASGSAVMLHLIDVLTRNRWRPKRTIVFVGFGAEEQGLYGSRALAHHWPMHTNGIACLLNMDMVGQGEPHVNISGLGAYPKMARHFASFLGQEVGKGASLHPRTGSNSDHWPFHETGVPAFFLSTKGPHPNYHTHLDDVENIKPEVLEAAARVVGTLLVRLGEHPEPLLDPKGLANYVLREGPIFTHKQLATALAATAADFDIESGVTAWIVDVEKASPQKAWQDLVALEKKHAKRVILVRKAADIGRAYQQGKIALLPRLHCHEYLAADPKKAAQLVALGYRWLAPLEIGGLPDEALLKACKSAGALVDISGVTTEDTAHLAQKALGDWPCTNYLPLDPELGTGEGWLAPHCLTWIEAEKGGHAKALALALSGKAPAACVEVHTPAFIDALHAHLSTAGFAAFDAQSPGRKALRGVLGGRLIEWLRRTEK